MIAARSLLRISSDAWKSKNTLEHLQKSRLLHGLSCELKMDVRKGNQIDVDRRKRKTVTQTWRAVSTQPNYCEDDVEKGEPEVLQEEVHSYVSSTVSIAKSETSNPKIVNEPSGPDTCPSTEGSNNDSSFDGKLMPKEKYSVPMEIGASLMRFIKGKGGGTQEEIEEETGVKILFPSSRKEDSITIEGTTAESVTRASKKIQSIIDKAVTGRDFDYSHFVSLPLAIHPGLVEKLVNFQNTILGVAAPCKNENLDSATGGDTSEEEEKGRHSTKVSVELKAEKSEVNIMNDQHSTKVPLVAIELKTDDASTLGKVNTTSIPLVSYHPKESKSPHSETCSSKLIELGIERSIFIKPKTFHLTVLMLKLWNKDRVKAAAEVLQSVSLKVKDALDNRPVIIRLKGLDCMRGSLSKARVLYAPVEVIGGEDRLLRACQVIIDAFVEAGLVIEKDVQQKLKLHATLMNARHRKRKKGTRMVDSFDARGIFDLYGSEEWGEYPIQEAHLSQRFMFDENGYYHCCTSIPFPEECK
ncbi:hypothetical protein ACJIZ3_025464 [Penstemon smallii]|uniref:K Homology domain-containing protein n=1 Tax=Penstemon smallii TaxID=265156 RepID=A0ABD3TY04_9LAMI